MKYNDSQMKFKEQKIKQDKKILNTHLPPNEQSTPNSNTRIL